MNKRVFLDELRKGLFGLPKDDVERSLDYYSEMIDECMEDGKTEEEAIIAMGTMDEIVSQIMADISFVKIAKEKIKPKRRLKTWEIVLLAVGSPVWVSLLIAAFAVVFALYISFWSVVVSLWAVFGSIVGCAFAGVIAGGVFAVAGNGLLGTMMISAGLVCAGIVIFFFYGCKAATKGAFWLTKKWAAWTKKLFLEKEGA